jgi:hypothetical protein
MEHVASRPVGDNSYRNVVAACRNCNNHKGQDSAEDHLRALHRSGYLSASEFKTELKHSDAWHEANSNRCLMPKLLKPSVFYSCRG